MADVYGKSSLLVPVTTSEVLYQCPEISSVSYSGADNVAAAAQDRPVQTQVTNLVLCHWDNTPGGAHTVTVWHTSGDIVTPPSSADGINDKDILLHAYSIAENDTVSLNLGILMSAGEKIWVEGDVDDHISATLYYIEVS
jgi:hypothetical protein